ncbi:uncharacterized protein LOC119165111 isoform X2 [Rhipicephalus microplus]|uniref:uncharacterized protein LOC119165111 isoform X2 n=1 Tax=Rhipicephalus microplus TaxID=6941 RepID=UPI003F6A6B80
MARIETNTIAENRTKKLRLGIAYSSKFDLKNMAVKENHHTQRTSACDHKDLEKVIRERSFLKQVNSTRMARMHTLCVDEPTSIDRNSL